MRFLSAIRATIRQMLRDEFVSGEAFDFEDDELDLHISEALAEISGVRPYEVKQTLKTSDGSKELDLTELGLVNERFLSFVSDDYTSAVVADIGKTVTGDTTGDTGELLGYDNTLRLWRIKMDDSEDLFDVAEAITITDGTGTGTTEGASGLCYRVPDLLFVDRVEYKVDQAPKAFRNFKVWGNILTIDTTLTPSADEDVYLYCCCVHQLTESSSTLKPQLERILVQGVTGRAAVAKARTLIDKVNIGGGRTPADLQAWGLTQLALYKTGLDQIPKPRVYREYPRD